MTPLICPTCGAQTPRLAGTSGAAVTCLKCRAPIPAESLAPAGEAGADAPTTPVYHIEGFQPTRGGSPVGVFAALGVGLIAALVLGAIAAVVRQFFWLVLIFPALFGMGLGVAVSAGAWMAKCRRTELVAGAGVIVGFAGAFVLHYVSYLIALSNANVPAGAISFTQYLDLLCQAGVMGFGYTASVVYYLVEVVVILIASGALAVVMLNGPFCEPCGEWKSREALGTFKINTAVAAAAVSSGQPARMVAPPDADDEAVTLEVYRCPNCRNNGPIEVRATCTKGKGENAASLVVFVTYPGEAAVDFEEVRRQCTG